ncbi:RRM_1 domain-containing protein, partial [Cephalotus follicularis]
PPKATDTDRCAFYLFLLCFSHHRAQKEKQKQKEKEKSSLFSFHLQRNILLLFISTQATMSDKGEKACPLCAEEMDLTDQQLKPCNCGYEICVWCWNHIMEMAEKVNTEGRCPACRTSYDKEKIVRTAANCERLVAEINLERKQKSQKPKSKPSEGKTHLADVRVIQRNLVYIIGLPLNLADEDLLQRREYFGQYGRVLKVSISRTATGAIQYSANNSCCVYIMFSKEEEAVRCIQSVHSFVLESRCLRACFGTTKYCHAWLRNMPCNIPDCLYLHNFGSQEDSFTKDDLVSAFQRSKVQQIVGSTINMRQRSGNFLPPPADQYTNRDITSTGRPVTKRSSNNIEYQNKGSCADNGPGRSNALPAATSWVTRVSASQLSVTNSSCSGGAPSSKAETSNGPPGLASEVSTNKSSLDERTMTDGESCGVHSHCKMGPLELAAECNDSSQHIALSNPNEGAVLGTSPAIVKASSQFSCLLAYKGIDRDIAAPQTSTGFLEPTEPVFSPDSDEADNVHIDGVFPGLYPRLSSVSIHNHLKNEISVPVDSLVSNHIKDNVPVNQGSPQDIGKPFKEPSAPSALRESMMDDNLDLDHGQLKPLKDTYGSPSRTSPPSSLLNLNQSVYHSRQQGKVNNQIVSDAHPRVVAMKLEEFTLPLISCSRTSSGFSGDKTNSFTGLNETLVYSSVFSEARVGNLADHDNNLTSVDNMTALDTEESSIISKILSIDIDAWGGLLTSPRYLGELLSNTDKQHGSLKIPKLRKVPDSKQSRFSFARQDDFFNQVSDVKHVANACSSSYDLQENKDFCMEKYENISSSLGPVESDIDFLTFPEFFVSNITTTTPPGSVVPDRAPPPGFPPHGRMKKAFDTSASQNRIVGSSGDVEFFDPAILEVGNGIMPTGLNDPDLDMRPTLSAHPSHFDPNAGIRQLMRQSVSACQNPRFLDPLNNRFSPPNETHSILSMPLDQLQPNNQSAYMQSAEQFADLQMSKGHWGLWNEVKSISELSVSELVAKGGLGLNKFVPIHEDLRSQMSGSSNLYNRGFAL